MKRLVAICIMAAVMGAVGCDDRRGSGVRSSGTPAGPTERPTKMGAINAESEIGETDYLYLQVHTNFGQELNFSVPTRVHLAVVYGEPLTFIPGMSPQQAADKRAAALHRALLPDEDGRYRAFL